MQVLRVPKGYFLTPGTEVSDRPLTNEENHESMKA